MKNLICVLAIMFAGCTVSQSDAERVLGDEGLHNVTLSGYAMFACSDDDDFNSRYVAYRTVLWILMERRDKSGWKA